LVQEDKRVFPEYKMPEEKINPSLAGLDVSNLHQG
jgi:hypothetical protein